MIYHSADRGWSESTTATQLLRNQFPHIDELQSPLLTSTSIGQKVAVWQQVVWRWFMLISHPSLGSILQTTNYYKGGGWWRSGCLPPSAHCSCSAAEWTGRLWCFCNSFYTAHSSRSQSTRPEFDQAKMRSHLLKCLTNRQLPFPTLQKRSFRYNHFPIRKLKCSAIDARNVQCDKCEEWFHMNCVGLSTPPLNCENWFCSACKL